jgi:hypothetical protein
LIKCVIVINHNSIVGTPIALLLHVLKLDFCVAQSSTNDSILCGSFTYMAWFSFYCFVYGSNPMDRMVGTFGLHDMLPLIWHEINKMQ